MDRETLGKTVRQAWISYCIEIGDTKESHVAPWEELSEQDKEADRRIGEAVVNAVLASLDLSVMDMRYVVARRRYDRSSQEILGRYAVQSDAEADARQQRTNNSSYIVVYDPRYPQWEIYTISRRAED